MFPEAAYTSPAETHRKGDTPRKTGLTHIAQKVGWECPASGPGYAPPIYPQPLVSWASSSPSGTTQTQLFPLAGSSFLPAASPLCRMHPETHSTVTHLHDSHSCTFMLITKASLGPCRDASTRSRLTLAGSQESSMGTTPEALLGLIGVPESPWLT